MRLSDDAAPHYPHSLRHYDDKAVLGDSTLSGAVPMCGPEVAAAAA